MNKAEVEQFADALAKSLASALATALLTELKPGIEKIVWRSIEVRSNDLDLLISEFWKLKDAFDIVGKEYCQKLLEKHIHQALAEIEASLRRQKKFNPGVNRRLL